MGPYLGAVFLGCVHDVERHRLAIGPVLQLQVGLKGRGGVAPFDLSKGGVKGKK